MFFDCLPPTLAAEFEQLGGRRHYGVGEALFLEGARAGEVLVLRRAPTPAASSGTR